MSTSYEAWYGRGEAIFFGCIYNDWYVSSPLFSPVSPLSPPSVLLLPSLTLSLACCAMQSKIRFIPKVPPGTFSSLILALQLYYSYIYFDYFSIVSLFIFVLISCTKGQIFSGLCFVVCKTMNPKGTLLLLLLLFIFSPSLIDPR